ncbi:Sister chromatid cohesion factor (Chl12) [Rasamsonia emersonii CBS 393.64]|uniref:Sister chromatid cohesion factor (Chl12) n=1 Tax=Rasamsonia emersonii (strain ATCC 16479 / CBS 393.64 / IMI 116815) TaxID=1408163 RepID=A0A0F4YWJ0_RASE3|nr:Sister chromatid cohesion factor (Chl12) [Rasamsonia emersonii CBS 393.64]KKA22647.1 Sister chromatid cohesion factor (Chl12) [Rasamsonia emersonii CBS 393.64]
MANNSPPQVPSSFDPALYFHSELPDTAPSESFSDDIEALYLQRLETAHENRRKGVVIQHRAWNLSDVFRSDDDVQPVTPTKSQNLQPNKTLSMLGSDSLIPSTPPIATMPFISSPVAYPPSSSPPTEVQKRKLEDPATSKEPKRQKTIGGFVEDDDDDDDELEALRDAHLKSEFALLQENPPSQHAAVSSAPSPLQLLSSQASGPGVNSMPSSSDVHRHSRQTRDTVCIKTCSGKVHSVRTRDVSSPVTYERLVASRSTTAPGKAQRSYYGIEIHRLLDEAAKETKRDTSLQTSNRDVIQPSIETPLPDRHGKKASNSMWTEKYRARKFADLIGDERTHRAVLRWLKGWDPIVFPGLAKHKQARQGNEDSERSHRKVLLLTGPPGLGKTTLAHVCAKQAGYEVLEINASDDRSKDVVKGRIRDAVGTENVKSVNFEADGEKLRKTARPVCVVVDEVDGVVGGSGTSGEGGFIKALIDLVQLDQKNSSRSSGQSSTTRRKKKGDDFRLLRPLILICNDIYHPSLRPLRTAKIAEIIHVRQVPLENVVQRMKNILEREGIPYDGDGVRRLCEATWGLNGRKDRGLLNRGIGEGDIRSVLVAAEWVAHKLRATCSPSIPRLTKTWLEQNILDDSQDGSSRGLGRGGVREIVDRVFMDGAGFPDAPVGSESFRDPFTGEQGKTPVGVADLRKRHAINRLREMVDTSGEYDRCITECFAVYPTQTYQDDTFLSKPNAAYDWLHFHDMISSRVFSNQDWELNSYLSQSVVAFHHLFASATQDRGLKDKNDLDEDENEDEHPFSGPKADFAAFEAQKQNRSIVTGFQASFSASLMRLFRSTDCVVTELIPNLVRMLSPDVKPVVVRGSGEQNSVASVRKESERALIRSAVRVMSGLGVTFEKARVENENGAHGGWIYRMEPFSKIKGTELESGSSAPIRYAVRQVLDQEYRKEALKKQSEASQSKYGGDSGKSRKKGNGDEDKDNDSAKSSRDDHGVKRDFFGRIINEASPAPAKDAGNRPQKRKSDGQKIERRVWVTYHEGFSNAVRKPISMSELLAEL